MASEHSADWLRKLNDRPGVMIWLPPACSAALFIILAWIAKPIVERSLYSDVVAQCDTTVREWFRARATPQLDRFFVGLSLLGSPVSMIVYALAGLSLLVNRRRWTLIYCWDTVFLGIVALTISLKNVFHRARPEGAERFLNSTSFAFPSTHSVSAVAGFGMIAYVLAAVVYKERDQRAILVLVTTGWVLLMGASRLYLGVHYLSDVIAGLAIGGAWLAVCLWSHHKFSRQSSPANNSQSQSP